MVNSINSKSRRELLQWVNKSIKTDFTKVEDMATGAAYCQLMDMAYPGSIPLKKVKFQAKTSLEFARNFKLVQESFKRLKINKHIPVEKLILGRFQDNFDFLRLFHSLLAQKSSNTLTYEAFAARMGEELTPYKRNSVLLRTKERSVKGLPKQNIYKNNHLERSLFSVETTGMCHEISDKPKKKDESFDFFCAKKEREFYFEKLRKIEILCMTESSENSLVNKIKGILYETEDEAMAPTGTYGEEDLSLAT